MKPKAIVALSGGVDSAVTAHLMQQQGYDCIGVTMRLMDTDRTSEDINDARRIADTLGMPFEAVDWSARFQKQVIDRFVCAYERGLTPNPCLYCNRYLKFEAMLALADEWGCDVVATGHYARITEQEGRYSLEKAKDLTKDQSYVLYSLTQAQLKRVKFPLGDFTKEEARRIAEEHGFVNAHKRDSQDICFVPDGDYASFIRHHTGRDYPAGPFVDVDGNVRGTHKGLIHYTIGQRKGLGLALPAPLYVCEKRPDTNEVVLCDNERLFSTTLTAYDVNWFDGTVPAPREVTAKVRYRHEAQAAFVTPVGEDRLMLTFTSPQRAITKGQAVVLYDGDRVLGGGIIE